MREFKDTPIDGLAEAAVEDMEHGEPEAHDDDANDE